MQSCRLLEKMDLEECVLITDATLIHLAMGCPRLEKLVSHHCLISLLSSTTPNKVTHCVVNTQICVALNKVKIFSGQQFIQSGQHFRDHLCPHYQELIRFVFSWRKLLLALNQHSHPWFRFLSHDSHFPWHWIETFPSMCQNIAHNWNWAQASVGASGQIHGFARLGLVSGSVYLCTTLHC